jgi:YD repeat-containing protein
MTNKTTSFFAIVTGSPTGAGVMSSAVASHFPPSRTMGAAEAHAAVNAETGNLCFSAKSMQVTDLGVKWPLGFVYNSHAKTPWQLQGFDSVGPASNSSVQFTRADGALINYQYDATRKAYVHFDPEQGLQLLTQQADRTWVHTTPLTGVQKLYDISGRLTARIDKNGNQTIVTYEGNTLITLPSGQTITYEKTASSYNIYLGGTTTKPVQSANFDAQGRLTDQSWFCAEDESSYFVNYDYDAKTNFLESATQADQTSLQFAYDANLRVSTVQDGEGRVETLAYADGTCTVTNGLKQTTQYAVSNQQLTAVTLPNGEATNFAYDASTGLVDTVTLPNKAAQTYGYDANGLVISANHQDAGNTIQQPVKYLRDADGRVLNRITFVNISDQQAVIYEHRFIYDANGNALFDIENEAITQHDYDAQGNRVASRRYVGLNGELPGFLPTKPITPADLADFLNGQPKSAVQLTTYSYYANGQLKTATRYAHVDQDGNGIFDGDTQITTHTWDSYGNELTHTQAINAKDAAVTAKSVDPIGRQTSLLKANGDYTTWQYDDANASVTETLPSGLTTQSIHDKGGRAQTSIAIDPKKDITRTTNFKRDAAGQLFATVLPNGQSVFRLYNTDGRLAFEIDQLGVVTALTYDSNGYLQSKTQYVTAIDVTKLVSGQTSLTVPTDPNDRTSYTIYNAIGQLQYAIVPKGDPDETLFSVKEMFYNDAGEKIQSTAYATPVTPGQVQTLIAGTAAPAISANDRSDYYLKVIDTNSLYHQDAKGYVTRTDHDGLGREIQRVKFATPTPPASNPENFSPKPDPVNDAWHFSYYDGANKIGEINAENIVTKYTYDQSGRVQSKRVFVAPAIADPMQQNTPDFAKLVPPTNTEDHVETYVYDKLGRLKTTTYSNSNIHSLTYDSNNRHLTNTQTDQAKSATRTQAHSYDAFDQCESATNARSGVIDYGYDKNGLRLSSSDEMGRKTVFYYDAAGRMIAEIDAEGCVKQYEYNAFGEKTQARKLVNKLSADQVATLTGGDILPVSALLNNLQSGDDVINNMTYNQLGKLATETDGENYQTTHGYNAFGEQFTKTVQIDQQNTTLQHEYDHDLCGNLQSHVLTGTDGQSKITKGSWQYDMHQKVVSHTDATGAATTYKNDRVGREVLCTDALGRTTSKTWDMLGRVKSVTDSLKHITQYVYTQLTRSMQKIMPTGASSTTTHNAFDQIDTVIDPNGVKTQKAYEKGGKLESVLVDGKLKDEYRYNPDGSYQQHADANQSITAFGYDNSGQLTSETTDPDNQKQTVTRTLDGAKRVVKSVDEAGIITTFKHDKANNEIEKVVDTAGLQHTTTKKYDGLKQATSKTLGDVNTPKPFVQKTVFDDFARALGATKDPDGLAITTKKILNDNGQAIAEVDGEGALTYLVRNAVGKLIYKINQAGGVTQSFYDANDRVTKTIQYTQGIGSSTFTDKQPAVADVAALIKTDSADVTSYRVYNDDGHLVYKLATDGSVTAFTLDLAGRATAIRQCTTTIDLTTLTDVTQASIDAAMKTTDNDRLTYHIYNAQGQQQYHIQAKENGLAQVTEYAYTLSGQVTDEWRYDAPIDLTSVTPDASPTDIESFIETSDNDRHTQHLFDSFGNARYQLRYKTATTVLVDEYHYDQRNTLSESRRYQTALTLPTSVSIDNIAAAITQQNIADESQDLHRVYTYDGLRRKAKVVTNPNNQAINYEESWTHDAVNNQLNHHDRLGQDWGCTFDGAGRKQTSTTPEVAVNDLVLNDDGTQYQLTPAQSVQIETGFTYDKNNRMLTQTFAQGTAKAHTKTITRDALGHAVSVSEDMPVDDSSVAIQKLGDRPDKVQTITKNYTFDVHGRKLIQPNKTNEAEIVVHNSLGQKAFDIDHEGTVTQYGYNAFKQLSRVLRYATRITLTDDMLQNGVSLATVQSMVQTSAQDRSISFKYDMRGHKAMQQEDARLMAYSQGGELQLKSARPTKTWAYNNFNELMVESTVVSPDGTVTADVVHRHDSVGDEIAMVDPRGHLTVMVYNASKQVTEKSEYINPLPATANPQTDSVERLAGAITVDDRDEHTAKAYNPLGYKTSSTKKLFIADQIGVTSSGLPLISTQAAKDLITRFVPDALGRVTETHFPATAEAGASSEYVAHNALGKKTKVVHTPRANGPDKDAKTLTPVTLLSHDVYGHPIATTRYQDSTAGASGKPVDAQPTVDPSNRRELIKTDPQGRPLLKQDAEGFWQQTTYKAYGLAARSWKFLTHWTTDNQQTNVLAENQHEYNSLGSNTQTTTNDGAQTYTEYTSFNVFGEWVSRGFDAVTQPIQRAFDNTGNCWRTNEKNGVAEINITDGMGSKVVLTLRAPEQDLMQVEEADIATVAAQDFTQVQKTICERRPDGSVAAQYQPSFTQPKSLPLHIDINTGPDKAFGKCAMTWPAPALSSTKMVLTLWKPGEDNKKQTFNPSIHGNRAGVDVSALDTDQYQFEIEYFYKDPQTKVVDTTPYRSGGGTIPLATGKDPQDAKSTMLLNEGGNKLVIAGKDPGWKGVALVQNGKIISRHAFNRIGKQAPFIDLSQQVTGQYDIYPFEDWAPTDEAEAERVAVDWRNVSLMPDKYTPPVDPYDGSRDDFWYPQEILNDPEFAVGCDMPATPPTDTEYRRFVLKTAAVRWAGDLPPYYGPPAYEERSLSCLVPNQHPYLKGTGFCIVDYISDRDDARDFVFGSYQGFARVALYQQDANGKLWKVGLMHNPNEPALAPILGWQGYLSLSQAKDYGVELGDDTLQLNPWIANYRVMDGSGIDNPTAKTAVLKTLPSSIKGLRPVATTSVVSERAGPTLQCYPVNITDLTILNHDAGGGPGTFCAGPSTWEIDFSVSPSWVKKSGVFQFNTNIDYYRPEIESAATVTDPPDPATFKGVVAYGPNHLNPIPMQPVAGCHSVIFGSTAYLAVSYIKGDPISLTLHLFDDAIPVLGDTPPGNPSDEHYTLPDTNLLYFSLPGISSAHTASFSYFDTTLGDAGDWVSVADVKVTSEGNIVVPSSDVDAGKYQYRLKVFNKAGSAIDLSKILDHQTTIDANGHVVGEFSTGGDFATYTSTEPATQVISPKRTQETDRHERLTSRTDERGHNTTCTFRAHSKHPVTTEHPQITVTDETGKSTEINPVEHHYIDERDRVIGHSDNESNKTIHHRNAIGDAVRTLGDDGVYKDQAVDGFRDVREITSQLPTGDQSRSVDRRPAVSAGKATSTLTREHDRRGKKTSETDAIGNKKGWAYDVDGNAIMQTDAKGNSVRSHYNALKKALMSRQPMGETTDYTYCPHQVVLSQITSNATEKEVLSWTYDVFGNKATQTDLGGVTTTYHRNKNQQITDENGANTGGKTNPHGVRYVDDQKNTAPVPMNQLKHIFNEAGFEICVQDEGMNQTTHYLIAPDGQRESEWFEDQFGEIMQGVTKHRNAMGWMDRIDDLRYFMQRLFDANGNIRCVKVSYFNQGAITPIPEQDEWFTYNPAGEMVFMKANMTAKGIQLANGKGTKLDYEAGFRVKETTLDSSGNAKHKNIGYYDNGAIKSTDDSDGNHADFGYDPNSVRTDYKLTNTSINRDWTVVNKGKGKATRPAIIAAPAAVSVPTVEPKPVIAASSFDTSACSADNAQTTDTDPHEDQIAVNKNGWPVEQIHVDKDGHTTSDDTSSNFTPSGIGMHQENQMPQSSGAVKWLHDTLDQVNNLFVQQMPAKITASRSMDHGDGPTYAAVTATQTANGFTESIQGDLDDTFRFFLVNHEGRIILKRTGVQSGATEFYFYDTEGRPIGRAGDLPPTGATDAQGKPADINFTMNDLPIGENWPPSLGVDSVQALFDGQTFSSIAENVYCDSSFGDLIGFQAGYKGDESIPAEMRVKLLILQATINRNWEGEYMPYDADKIIGSLYPKIPIPALKDTHKEWVDVLAFAFAIAASILVPELMGFMFAGTAGAAGTAAAVSAGVATTTAEDIAVGVTTAAVADVGQQEIEIAFGNQQKFNMHELDLALVGGAVGGLAAGLNGVSLLKATPFQASWKSIELEARVSLVKTMLNEAIHHGKVDWRGFVTDVIDSAIAAETTHVMPGGGEGGLIARDMADSVADDLMKDAVYHRTPDWQNVAVDAAGTAIGTVVGDQMSAAIDEQRQKAAERALIQNAWLAKVNSMPMNMQALGKGLGSDPLGLDHEFDLAHDGYDFDLGGFADPTTGSANDDGYASGDNLAGHVGDAYGTTVHQPVAQIHQPNAAQSHRDAVSSTVQMANALSNHIKAETEHVFAQKTSQDALQDIEAKNVGLHVRDGIEGAYNDINNKMWDFTDRHPYLESACVGFNNAVAIASLATPATGLARAGLSLGATALDGLSSLASTASMFGDTRLVADGATMSARDLGAETASTSSRMNTSSSMYSKSESELGGKKLESWKMPNEALGDMNPSQQKNLDRFLDKLPKNSENIKVKTMLKNGKIFQADSPASNISGSFARYEKQIDEFGKTVLYTKTTFGPDGEILHIAQKFPPAGKFYPEIGDVNQQFPGIGG